MWLILYVKHPIKHLHVCPAAVALFTFCTQRYERRFTLLYTSLSVETLQGQNHLTRGYELHESAYDNTHTATHQKRTSDYTVVSISSIHMIYWTLITCLKSCVFVQKRKWKSEVCKVFTFLLHLCKCFLRLWKGAAAGEGLSQFDRVTLAMKDKADSLVHCSHKGTELKVLKSESIKGKDKFVWLEIKCAKLKWSGFLQKCFQGIQMIKVKNTPSQI